MSNYNLQSNYDGSIFQYSKEEQAGFKKFTNTAGTVSYRKYFNKGVTGELVYISKRENEYRNNAEEITLGLRKNEDDVYYITFPIMDNHGDAIDDFAEALILLLPKLELGEEYNVNNWRMKKGDKIKGEIVKYNKSGVTIKQDGEKIKTDFTFEYIKARGTDDEEHVKGDVPMLHWKEIAGKNRPTAASKEDRLVFLYDILTTELDRLIPEETSENVPAEAQKDKKEAPKTAKTEKVKPQTVPSEDEDDLPF